MVTETQVIQRAVKRKELLINLVKAMLALTIYWAVLFCIVLFSEAISIVLLNKVVNAFKLFFGISIGVIALVHARRSKESYLMLGVGLAVLSWTLGQLYCFSYIYLMESELPYPSIADFGYIGAYYFLIGVIDTITSRIPQYTVILKFRNLWPLVLLLVPFLLALVRKNPLAVNIGNLALILAIIFTLWKAQPIFRLGQYRIFLFGVCLLCLCDIVFMVSIDMYPELYTLTTDAIYPIALSLSVCGFMKVEEMVDG